MVINRANGTLTPKSQIPNIALVSAPVVGTILAAPKQVLMTSPNGDPTPPLSTYISYAWSGGTATLDGYSVTGNAGMLETSSNGMHTLMVGSSKFNAQVSEAPTPSASFDASLDNNGTILTWSVMAGTFIDAAIDQGVIINPVLSGSVHVTSTIDKVYRFYALTQEGGVLQSASSNAPILNTLDNTNVMVGLNAPNFYGSLPIINTGGGTISWTAVSSNPTLVQVLTPNGQTETQGVLNFSVTINPQSYPGIQSSLVQTELVYIDIDAGEAGTQRVAVNIIIVEHLEQLFLPLVIH
jgi:hypothetical protein